MTYDRYGAKSGAKCPCCGAYAYKYDPTDGGRWRCFACGFKDR